METIQRIPASGDHFRHIKRGTEYEVMAVTNLDAHDPFKFPITVVYTDGKSVWSRPAHTFMRKFAKVPR